MTPHTRRSIIQIVDLPDVHEVYRDLNDLLDLTFPAPVPHITLFAWSDHEPMVVRGINVSSRDELECVCVDRIDV